MTLDPFYVVWNPSHGVPKQKHIRHDDARAEAERLALVNPGQEFFVLSASGRALRAEPVEWVEVDPIPF